MTRRRWDRWTGAAALVVMALVVPGTHRQAALGASTTGPAVVAFGDAQSPGDPTALRPNRPVVAMASTPDGQGYWLVASDGGIFAFGNAGFHGSTGGIRLN